ncbi:MAG: ATP-binding cassette domain-containing protein [Paludibacter sp.]
MLHTLKVDGVILNFGERRILQNVYLKSQTGNITGLLGRNGTGKSCLMNIIYGELTPNSMSVRINDNSLNTNYRNPKDIRYLPQFSFIPKSFKISKVLVDYDLDFTDFISCFPDFTGKYNTRISSLSGGHRRIVEIYTLLASKTKFCMLDEPFSQVMPIHLNTIKDLIVREKQNKGIIITDHLYKHIIDICDDLYVISNGQTYLTKDLTDLKKYGYIA